MEMKAEQLIDPVMGQCQEVGIFGHPCLGIVEVRIVYQDGFHLIVAFDQSLNQRSTLRNKATAEPGQVLRTQMSIGFHRNLVEGLDMSNLHKISSSMTGMLLTLVTNSVYVNYSCIVRNCFAGLKSTIFRFPLPFSLTDSVA